MSINVYWACLEDQWIRATEPVPIYSNFLKNEDFVETNVTRCPAFSAELKNLYGIRSLYDYKFHISNDTIKSDLYDQNFFDNHVMVRSFKERTFSFLQYYTFFTDCDSLLMTTNLQPYLEKNNSINDSCICFPGVFDIGKWFRNLDFAFHLKEQSNDFIIKEKEIYCYTRFHTNEKINFIQYRHSPELASFLKEIIASKLYSKSSRNLVSYYKMFKTKKMILKEIKKNIL